ncbi:tetratricopeptide repeat protein [Magnetococcales bacterium HHB-1]
MAMRPKTEYGLKAIFLLPLFCLLVAPIQVIAADGKAEAVLAKQALKRNNLSAAVAHYLQAYQQAPRNKDYIHNVAVLSVQTNMKEQALTFFQKGADLAAEEGRRDDLTLYNSQISEILATTPTWVAQKINEASAITPSKTSNRALRTWQSYMGRVTSHSQKGEIEHAERFGRKALKIAQTHFGEHHLITVSTRRDLAMTLFQHGQGKAAEPLLRDAISGAKASLGKNHPETLVIQAMLAIVLESEARFSEVADLYRAISEGYQQSFGDDFPETLKTRQSLARTLQHLGEYRKADALLAKVCRRLSERFGANHHEMANCLYSRGEVNQISGEYQAAEHLFKKTLQLQKRLYKPDSIKVLRTIWALANIDRVRSRFDQAKKRLNSIIALAEKGGMEYQRILVDAKGSLSKTWEDTGQFESALKLAKEVFQLERKALGEDHPNTLAALNEVANILRRKGDLVQAEKAFTETLDRYRKVMGKAHPGTIAVMNNLALVLENKGDYDKAEPLFKDAVKLARQKLGDRHLTTLSSINNMAMFHEAQGNFESAEPLYESSLAFFRKRFGMKHPDTVAVLNNLAYLYMLQQDYKKAEPKFKKAVEVWQEILGEKHRKTLKGINNLARVLTQKGEYDTAEALFDKALMLRTEVLGSKHMDTLRSMHDLANLYRIKKQYDKALALLSQGLQLAETTLGKQHPYTFEMLNTKAQTLQDQGSLVPAFETYQEGFERRNHFLNRMLWVAGDNAREGYVRLHRPELDNYIAMLSKMTPEVAGKALLDIGLQRKGLLLKITSEIQQIVRMKDDEKLAGLANQLTETRKKLASLTLAGPEDVNSGEEHLDKIHAMELRIDELERMLGRASSRYRQSVSRASVTQLATSLPEQTVVIDFFIYNHDKERRLAAAILQKQNGKAKYSFMTYKSLEEVNKLIKAYRETIQDEDADDDEVIEIGQIAYDAIWLPLKPFVEGMARIYLVPDGLLNILPFNALVDDEETYLVEKADLYMLTTSRDLLPKTVGKTSGAFVTLAGPDYNTDEVAGEQLAQAQARRSARQRRSARVVQQASLSEEAIEGSGKRSAVRSASGEVLEEDYVAGSGRRSAVRSASGEVLEEDYVAGSGRRSAVRSASGEILDGGTRSVRSVSGEELWSAELDSGRRSATRSALQQRAWQRAVEITQGLRAMASGMRGLRFDPLPGAEKEGKLIVEQANTEGQKNQLFIKETAQEQVLRELELPPDILHIATHGFFLKADDSLRKRLLKLQRGSSGLQLPPPGDNPLLRAGLAFAGINSNAQFLGEIDTDNDGVLTALEVLSLDLQGTRLAVLSACETGLGEIHEGEGVYGLRRAFQEAGVQSVVNSLWEVSDAGTQALMTGLYQRLLKGKKAHQALREVQLEMLASATWSQPYIWSAFYMVGRE